MLSRGSAVKGDGVAFWERKGFPPIPVYAFRAFVNPPSTANKSATAGEKAFSAMKAASIRLEFPALLLK